MGVDGMAYNLMPCDREQRYLMPPSLEEWLPEGDLVWLILDVVEQMDLREFYAAYREDGWGAAAYDPKMMVGILLYAYCQGIRSSRRIAWALERDIGFRVVAANQQPDFRTICRFRAEHEEALERLFVQVLRLCREAGLVKLGLVALDGTKVAADAALAANRSYTTIEEEVRRMLNPLHQPRNPLPYACQPAAHIYRASGLTLGRWRGWPVSTRPCSIFIRNCPGAT